ncbi:phosphonate C-P lyase system protein PhnG [Nisaea sp.]|uniref:phosphonate C-P lyase system protein PhnG n=1 Tax=Nisaea sp. TaxID=2024842 RepID=UPI003B52687A
MEPQASPPNSTERKRWMSILAKASYADLNSLWQNLPDKPEWSRIRAPEIGMVMVRGRMGGTGNRFNIGEMTVTRCTVGLTCGAIGHGYVSGRNKEHAEVAAVIDALMQRKERAETVEHSIIKPLELRHLDRRNQASKKAAATKVEFFTVAREN